MSVQLPTHPGDESPETKPRGFGHEARDCVRHVSVERKTAGVEEAGDESGHKQPQQSGVFTICHHAPLGSIAEGAVLHLIDAIEYRSAGGLIPALFGIICGSLTNSAK